MVAAYGLILPQPILDAPRLGCLNVHASLLPRWRGAAPIQRAILAGDAITGVTIMQMEAGLDTGPMLLKREAVRSNARMPAQVTEELAKLGATAMVEVARAIRPASDPCPSPRSGVTYAPRSTRTRRGSTGRSRRRDIERQVRAFAPLPGAWFECNGERIKLLDAERARGRPGQPGEVLDDCLTIAAGEGASGR